jgi:NADH-quinone oxidoreductase subunit N
MNLPRTDLLLISPQLWVIALAMIVLVADAVWPRLNKRGLANGCLLGLLVAAALVAWQWPGGEVRTVMNGMLLPDVYTGFFNLLFIIGSAISILLSVDYLEREGIALGEYYALLLFTTVGMMVMASASNLIVLFLGLEILSISLYVMAGYQKDRLISEEAALKYFLLGAFSSAFFLYGIALTYGAGQNLGLQEIHEHVAVMAEDQSRNNLLIAGVSLMIVGFGFKVAVVPFHIWTPDVYEGAPTAVTAFMSVGAKAAGFAAFVRVLALAFPTPALSMQISAVIASVATLTMIVGNVVAIAQRNIKRMLAYSSIAHAGYILVGVVAVLRESPGGQGTGLASVLFYTLAYTFTNLGAFAVVLALRCRGEEVLTLDDFNGLGFRYPGLGALMALFMLSLAGMPPTAGFFGKLYLFRALLNLPENVAMPWLAVVAVLTSVVSFFYYIRVVTNMYMQPEGESAAETEYAGRFHLGLGLAASALGTILLGLFPAPILLLANRVGDAIRAAQTIGIG